MFQVQSEACKTCIYGKNSASRASVQQLEDEIRDKKDPKFFSSFRICHYSDNTCCRGFWNRHKDHFQMGQITQRLGLVEYVQLNDKRDSST